MTTLIDALRAALDDPAAASFQLMGEDLILLTPDRLRAAADAHDEALGRVPEALRGRLAEEQAAFVGEAHRWLRLYNRSLGGRVRGYLALGRLCRFEYPWPVVAILGICQVVEGMARNDLYGLLGRVAARFGWDALDRLADGSIDLLRRTNRGIFADSVPIVLLALRAHDRRCAGEGALAEALLDGPLPLAMDETSRAIARELFDALAVSDGGERFRRLGELTRRHFEREQAVFTHQMRTGRPEGSRREPPALVRWLTRPRTVEAPSVERGLLGGRRVVFRPFRLPAGFVMRDHDARVEAFGRAFVRSVTGEVDDYRAAVGYVRDRFDPRGDPVEVAFSGGGARPTDEAARP